MPGNQVVTRGCTAWPKDAPLIGFGVIWAIDATLKWLPGLLALSCYADPSPA